MKTKYWDQTSKYGIKLPRNVAEARSLDHANGDTKWMDALAAEMKTVRPAFEVFEGSESDLSPGYKKVRSHVIWDVKLGENFRRKSRVLAGCHTTTVPPNLTYSSVVSRDSIRIALTVTALNNLELLSCDNKGAYLTAKCRERIYTIAGPGFGSEQGSIMKFVMALYGLKSSGASFRTKLAGVLHYMNYRPTKGDPDVWLRAATKSDGMQYYEMVLCYVDDVLVISKNPDFTIKGLEHVFELKGEKAERPSIYLGATLKIVKHESVTGCWTMSSEDYVKMAIQTVEDQLGTVGKRLPTKCIVPMTPGYHPAMDESP